MRQILIICESEPDAKQLTGVFRKAGLTSEVAKGITAGYGLAMSGKFRVVFCTPFLSDGSWKRLIDVTHPGGLSVEVILLARTFNLNQWGEALQAGAFDVLDILCDLPKAAEAAKRALGTKLPQALAAAARTNVVNQAEHGPPHGGLNGF